MVFKKVFLVLSFVAFSLIGIFSITNSYAISTPTPDPSPDPEHICQDIPELGEVGELKGAECCFEDVCEPAPCDEDDPPFTIERPEPDGALYCGKDCEGGDVWAPSTYLEITHYICEDGRLKKGCTETIITYTECATQDCEDGKRDAAKLGESHTDRDEDCPDPEPEPSPEDSHPPVD